MKIPDPNKQHMLVMYLCITTEPIPSPKAHIAIILPSRGIAHSSRIDAIACLSVRKLWMTSPSLALLIRSNYLGRYSSLSKTPNTKILQGCLY